MMPKIDSQIKNVSATRGGILDRSLEISIKNVMKSDRVENPTSNNSDIEDAEAVKCTSCASSVSMDSGCSSNTEDHVTEGLLNVSCASSVSEDSGCSSNTEDHVAEGLLNVSCASSVSEDSGCSSNTEDHVAEGPMNVSCAISSECKELKIDKFIDDDERMMESLHCGNVGRMVTQENWTFMNEDEKEEERRCDGFIDESDKVEKVSWCDLDDDNTNMMKEIFSRDVGQVDQLNEDADVSKTVHSFQSLQLASVKLTYCSENTKLQSSLERTENFELRKYPAVDVHLDSPPLYRKYLDTDPGNVCNKDIRTENQILTRTREIPDPVNSTVISKASRNLRTARRRKRCRIQDVNNNVASSRNLTSFLRRAPFKLQDCFHEHGLLMLVTCIVYTLILVIIISIISMIMETLKSVIGTENLKKIRKNILRHRRTRMCIAAG